MEGSGREPATRPVVRGWLLADGSVEVGARRFASIGEAADSVGPALLALQGLSDRWIDPRSGCTCILDYAERPVVVDPECRVHAPRSVR